MTSKFGWCADGFHQSCRRSVPGIYARTIQYCGCTEPTCPCAAHNKETPDEDRPA